MIVYQQAFDSYHTVYRMLRILAYFDRAEYIEIERLRIWDFYLLYPNKMSNISLKKTEEDVRKMIKTLIVKDNNPYESVLNDRIIFEKIKPYQMTAIKFLASYGIINKDYLELNRVCILAKDTIKEHLKGFKMLTIQEDNAIKLLTSHFYLMPLHGENGLKSRTKLLESKYDAQ